METSLRKRLVFFVLPSLLLSGCNSSPKSSRRKTNSVEESRLSSSSSSSLVSSSSVSSRSASSSPLVSSSSNSSTVSSSNNTDPNPVTFTITWANWDGYILEIDSNVPYGSFPSYDGATPQKEGDEQYSYIFDGWSPAIGTVIGNATYTAIFTQQEKPSDFSIFEVADGWAIENYTGGDSRITIPSSIKGHQIVEIAEKAFKDNSKLLTVSLPNSIKRIGKWAFYGCTRLYEINLPSSLESIGNACFFGAALTEIILPTSLKEAGFLWLFGCKISKVTFSFSITDTDFFIGDLFGVTSCTAYFNNGDNITKEHFKLTEEIETIWVSGNGTMGNHLPKNIYHDWELLSTNRFFNIKIKIDDINYYQSAFLNEPSSSSNITISKSTEYHDWDNGYGTVTQSDKVINYVKAPMFLGLDYLEEIVIPGSSTVTDKTLLGLLENVKVTRQ